MIFRPYRAADAMAVSQLFRLVYGDRYVQPDVYLPKLITQHNLDGRWQSMLAVEGSQILGHAALCRDKLPTDSFELALSVVHPVARGQNIATRLGRELLECAGSLSAQYVLIKQVTHHPFTQRMAQTLDFHCTGLLPDHVPSPYGALPAESIVIGVHPINGRSWPLPDIAWPESCRGFMEHLSKMFGTGSDVSACAPRLLNMTQNHQRIDVVIERLDKRLFDQLVQLPEAWLVSAKVALSANFSEDFERLSANRFVFTGLLPAPRQGHWFALFHRGAHARRLDLNCPHMQRLQDNLPRPRTVEVGRSAA